MALTRPIVCLSSGSSLASTSSMSARSSMSSSQGCHLSPTRPELDRMSLGSNLSSNSSTTSPVNEFERARTISNVSDNHDTIDGIHDDDAFNMVPTQRPQALQPRTGHPLNLRHDMHQRVRNPLERLKQQTPSNRLSIGGFQLRTSPASDPSGRPKIALVERSNSTTDRTNAMSLPYGLQPSPTQPAVERTRRASRTEQRQSLADLGYGKAESYARLQRLGHGTYATVYLGRSRLSNELVALKEILKEHDEGAPCTALREVSLLRLLRHNNIVTLHDICHTPKKLTLVFEYVGPDLYAYMRENNNLLSIHNIRVS